MNLKKAENIFSIVLLVAFFLPWISIGGLLTFSGYQIPGALESLIEMGNKFSEDKEPESVPLYIYLIYLIPVFSIAILFLDFKGIKTRVVSICASLFIFTILLIQVLDKGGELFKALGIGGYFTIIAAVGLLLGALNVINLEQKKE